MAFLLFNIPVALANNIGKPPSRKLDVFIRIELIGISGACRRTAVHLIFRFFTGFAGSAFLSISGGTVSDMFINAEVGP